MCCAKLQLWANWLEGSSFRAFAVDLSATLSLPTKSELKEPALYSGANYLHVGNSLLGGTCLSCTQSLTKDNQAAQRGTSQPMQFWLLSNFRHYECCLIEELEGQSEFCLVWYDASVYQLTSIYQMTSIYLNPNYIVVYCHPLHFIGNWAYGVRRCCSSHLQHFDISLLLIFCIRLSLLNAQ